MLLLLSKCHSFRIMIWHTIYESEQDDCHSGGRDALVIVFVNMCIQLC